MELDLPIQNCSGTLHHVSIRAIRKKVKPNEGPFPLSTGEPDREIEEVA